MITIVFLTGKSATGKDTILSELLKRHPDLEKAVSYTTRPQRAGEKDGEAYHFVTEEYFDKPDLEIIDKRTYKVKLKDNHEGKWTYVFMNDFADGKTYLVAGALSVYMSFAEFFKSDTNVTLKLIYLELPDRERLLRAIDRCKDGNYAEVCRRYLADEEDFREIDSKFIKGYGIKRFYNIKLEDCVHDIEKYLAE